jgi:hypothetical protein
MQMTDILGQIGGIQSVARELGVSEDQAASGAAAPAAGAARRLQETGTGATDGTGWPRRHAGRPRRRRLAGRRAGTAAHQLVAGYMAKQSRATASPQMGGGLGTTGGGLGDVLAGMVGGGGQGGLPGLASLLDLDRDGNPLDDILGMAGKLTRS